MKIEKLKRFNKWKWIGITLIFCVIVFIVTYNTTKAKYRFTASYQAAYGTVHFKSNDLEVLAVNIENDSGEYESSDNIPTSGYVLNETESYCGLSNGDGTYTKDDNITITYENGEVNINKITKKGTKCFLYFDIKKSTALETLLANNTVDTSRKSGEFTSVFTEDTSGRIFEGPADDYGDTTYFFAGINPNNWVKFGTYPLDFPDLYLGTDGIYGDDAFFDSLSDCESSSAVYEECTLYRVAGKDMYWRIIRVNGNGSIRLIYNGTDATTTVPTTQIGSSAFNSSRDDNAYVGYMFGTPGSDNYADTHANINDSTIKGVLDTWYLSSLASYEIYIDTDVGFCGERTSTTGSTNQRPSENSGGFGTKATSYRGYFRWPNILTCPQVNDLYTVKSSSYGNKALIYPIGLISVDEINFAGSYSGTSEEIWLSAPNYYTMTAQQYGMTAYGASVMIMGTYPSGLTSGVTVGEGVRPVINLKSDTVFSSGNGTSDSPYIVS